MFDKTKANGITYGDWQIELSSLFERFSKSSIPKNDLKFFTLNFSPSQVFEFVIKTSHSLKKNKNRIFTMRGYGIRLTQIMNELRISQSSLSKKLGVSQPEISYYMRDRITPRPIVRQKIAYLLNTNYAWLSWDIGEKVFYEQKEFPLEHFQLTLAERIIFYTWWNKMTVKDLSKEIGVSNTAIQYWMDGSREPRSIYLEQLSRLFGLNEGFLIYGGMSNDNKTNNLVYLKKVHSILKR